MRKFKIGGITALDNETVSVILTSEKKMESYVRFREVLFQLQILKELLSSEIINKVPTIDHKRTYIFTIKECFNNVVYTFRNCACNLLVVFFPNQDIKKDIDRLYDIPDVKEIIKRKEGIRHRDVHSIRKGRYSALIYFSTIFGKDKQTRSLPIEKLRKQFIIEMKRICDKLNNFAIYVLQKIDKETGKRAIEK
jgi:hypothetical protein